MRCIYFLVQFFSPFSKYLALMITLIRDQILINVGTYYLKGQVQCFSMNKSFLLNPEKNGADPSYRFREYTKTHTLIPRNDVTEPKARLLLYAGKLLAG